MPDVIIDLYASRTNYLDHLLPIWRALEPAERGVAWVRANVWTYAQQHGLDGPQARRSRPSHDPERLTLVAGIQDHVTVVRAGRRSIYVEHGTGQTYDGDPACAGQGSYAGGSGRSHTWLFLVPSERVADANQQAYPKIPNAVVGSPRVDQLAGFRKPSADLSLEREAPLVGVSFHWRTSFCPEAGWAFGEYQRAITDLARTYRLLGHGHPRIWGRLERFWRTNSIPAEADWANVLRRIDCYVCDNSSTIYEAAACDVPVVVLNSRHYRRDVHHGLRFWSHADVGIQVNDPAELAEAVRQALADPPEIAQRRREISRDLYPYRGDAAQRAVEAIRRRERGETL